MTNKLRGSKLRCQDLTGLPRHQVAEKLSRIASPSNAFISENDRWMPCGREAPREAKLGARNNLLDESRRNEITHWWLKFCKGANTPNWDIASTCIIHGKEGLLLIEAKAHSKELSEAGKNNPDSEHGKNNHECIGRAIEEANVGLNKTLRGWKLSRDSHYQLSNRFAWSWKLASMGKPVVLIYLGFLNDPDMKQPFENAEAWDNCIRSHAKGIVPDNAWNKRLDVGGIPIWFLIRSTE